MLKTRSVRLGLKFHAADVSHFYDVAWGAIIEKVYGLFSNQNESNLH